jgi:2-isopropylmalate synthase
MPFEKYLSYDQQIDVPQIKRTWPDKIITQAPRWCSVDLRDGNQALVDPMNMEKKLKMWHLLVKLGFKEIEVGFPSASQTDFDFIRLLIDENLIPDDVTIGVLTQAREHLIQRTYECLQGAKHVYVHLYNSTSILQRDVVFDMTQDQIVELAVEGAKLCKAQEHLLVGTSVFYEYSPESFTGTEPEFAARISNEVADVFEPTPERRVIINLPSTVEMTTPNVYADSIEWMASHLGGFTDVAPDDGAVPGREKLTWTRDSLVISLHPHNDQGMGIAAAHLGLQAGGDRVEGCLFGNGERTGNVDVIAIALNLFVNGVDPELDVNDIREVRRVAEYCTGLPVEERHPYAGDLVFTAFSGSHQDAIKKGLDKRAQRAQDAGQPIQKFRWAVPYLPLDPADIGASYESVIRVNSQSGKGGIAYIMKNNHNLDLPKRLQIEFSGVVQRYADKTSKELSDDTIYTLFHDEYLPSEEAVDEVNSELTPWGRIKIISIVDTNHESDSSRKNGNNAGQSETSDSVLKVTLVDNGEQIELLGAGNGPIDAFINAIGERVGDLGEIQILDYVQHAMSVGQDARAAAYVECKIGDQDLWGVGIDSSTTKASLKAIISAVNRCERP